MLVARFIGIQGIDSSFIVVIFIRLYIVVVVCIVVVVLKSDFENEIQKNFSFFVPLFVSLDFKSIRMNKTLILLL